MANTSSNDGIGFWGLLTIVFITLKLLGKITWPWIWVLSPVWIGLSLVVVIILGAFVIAVLTKLF